MASAGGRWFFVSLDFFFVSLTLCSVLVFSLFFDARDAEEYMTILRFWKVKNTRHIEL